MHAASFKMTLTGWWGIVTDLFVIVDDTVLAAFYLQFVLWSFSVVFLTIMRRVLFPISLLFYYPWI